MLKTAQERGLEVYADAVEKVAYVHNVDPQELDAFLTGQSQQMEKNAQADYANSLMKVASAYNVDPYALDSFLQKEANPGAEIVEALYGGHMPRGAATEMFSNAGEVLGEGIDNIKSFYGPGGQVPVRELFGKGVETAGDLLNRGGEAAGDLLNRGGEAVESLYDKGSQHFNRWQSGRGNALQRAGVKINDLGRSVRDFLPNTEGDIYSGTNKAFGAGAAGGGVAGGAAGGGALANKLKKKILGR